MTGRDQIKLYLSGEGEQLLARRMISLEAVEEVIRHAEATGKKFIDPSTGRSLAFLRPGRVTYWVEYSVAGDGFQVHSAYSHRMEMKRGAGS